ncbi:MAG: pyrroline-5-carboxylate reductase family protein [Solirubrobacterales bacterium]
MRLGFIGSGNMARAIALGLADAPTIDALSFSDGGSGRALQLADSLGGTATSTSDLVTSCDVLFLCHKPAQLAEVAGLANEFSGTVVSVLAATTLADLRKAFPAAAVVRSMPNVAVEFGSGVVVVAAGSDSSPALNELLNRLGSLIEVPEDELEIATAIGGCAPAFFAMFARDLIDAAARRGMSEAVAREIVGQTLRGTGDVLAANGVDTESTMLAVASPGGLTEKALSSFESSNLEDAVDRAVATVLGETS